MRFLSTSDDVDHVIMDELWIIRFIRDAHFSLANTCLHNVYYITVSHGYKNLRKL